MNRIYQGRVKVVEVSEGKDEKGRPRWRKLDNWQEALWRHHELFQDAINYYVVCLLALAQPGNSVYPIRERLDAHDEAGNPDELMVWRSFRRRGAARPGLRDFVAKYITPGNEQSTPEECFTAVLIGSESERNQVDLGRLDAGLRQLLSKCTGDAGCKNAAPVFLPRLCKPDFGGNYGEDPKTLLRENAAARFPFILHNPATRFDSSVLKEFGIHSIALPNPKKPKYISAEAIGKLREMVSEWRNHRPSAERDWSRIERLIDALPKSIEIPGYTAGSAKGEVKLRLFAMFLFLYVEKSEFTLELLRSTTPKPATGRNMPPPISLQSGEDPIQVSRGKRGYIFRAFTSLPCWGGDDSGIPEWIQFDIAAFEEALKALHQIDAKAEEREKLRKRKQAQLDYQRRKTTKWKSSEAGEEEKQPPVLAGDPRVARLEQLIDEELKDEYEMSEGVAVSYGLHQRTIRGFRELRKKWNEALRPEDQYGPALRDRLWKVLTDYKKDNIRTMGGAAIFDAMVEQMNWIIWREPTPEQLSQWREAAGLPGDVEFANDPLQALTDERELVEQIERLKEPIRFTPADPVHSRRQFYFSDITDLTARDRLRHDRQTVDVEIADKNDHGMWQKKSVRLNFTAPRLLRDQLNNTNGKDAIFQQAMMAALGLSARLKKTQKGKVREATFAECAAVALMPDIKPNGERRFLLNFPITLEDDTVSQQLGKAERWGDMQFGGADGESYWLRWPTTWHDEKKERKKALPTPWWQRAKPFSCLSVDLGQRDAAAFAVIEASPGEPPKPGLSRKLGEAEGLTWWGTVRATGLLRLPGEDAFVRRQRTRHDEDVKAELFEELSGERGRLATEAEWRDARDICENLGLNPNKILGTDAKYHSFPELNDQLLFALRRAQARLARLQSWSCIESNPKRKEAIAKQLKAAVAALEDIKDDVERDVLIQELKPFVERDDWNLVVDRLIREIERLRGLLPQQLERIANRIQALRGRRWEWVLRDGVNYVLRQTLRGTDANNKLLAGQRGLSIERIEQLESLRERCQSLNRALRQVPGQPANLGKSKRGIELPDPCPELLERLDALKEQRVNQTAHLILAQALGVRLRRHQIDDATRAAYDIHGEYERFRDPVDFIVLEHLDRYLANQGRSRAENSRLMKWCHRQILGKLKQLCEPYGLRVLETPPAYSSLFCSLTGVAGFRAIELTPDYATVFPWKKHLDRLQEMELGKRKLREGERRESERIRTLFRQLNEINKGVREANPERPKWRMLLAPITGGPIFVPASETERYERENPVTEKTESAIRFKQIGNRRPTMIQSDIGAAISHGFRALAAPDMSDIHVRIRTVREGDTFIVRAENVREKARWGKKPPKIHVINEKDCKKLLTETRPNFFVDIGSVADYDGARIDDRDGFASGRGIWGTIKGNDWHVGKDWQRCEEINAVRVERWKCAEIEEDIPF